MIMRIWPRMKRWRFPHTLAVGTQRNPATPTPSRWYPVSRATSVKLSPNDVAIVTVLAARIGLMVVQITATRDRMARIASRFQSGQFWKFTC